MRVVFMGTPYFAVPSLEALASAYDVALVITRPDAVRARGKTAVPSPVKEAAMRLSLPVCEAARVNDEVVAAVSAVAPDVIAVAAYGALLPDRLLQVAPLGAINVHASLLPRWRGAAPIQRALLAGDETVGVSIMRIASELDAGPYCRQACVEVGDRDASSLTLELAQLGATELRAALDALADGTARWVDQDVSQVSYAPKITKAEMRLSPAEAAVSNLRRVRASTDAAPAKCGLGGRGVRVMAAAEAHDVSLAPGQVGVMRGRVVLGCADGTALEALRVKPDGKREMDASAWSAGLRRDALVWAEL